MGGVLMPYDPKWEPLSREDIKECYSSVPDEIVDWSRRSGRTVRLLKQAYDLALEGKQVFFVVPLTAMIPWMKSLVEGLFAKKPPNLHVINVVPTRDWENNLRFKTAGRLNKEVVFDHFFWECLEDWYRKDLKKCSTPT